MPYRLFIQPKGLKNARAGYTGRLRFRMASQAEVAAKSHREPRFVQPISEQNIPSENAARTQGKEHVTHKNKRSDVGRKADNRCVCFYEGYLSVREIA